MRSQQGGRGPRPSFALILALAIGCATPGLPPAEPASPASAEVIERVQQLYLYPDHIDRRLLVGALNMLESRFDPVRFEERGEAGVLWVGDARASVPLDDGVVEPERFRQTLGQALAFVRAHLDPADLEDEDLELVALQGALHALDRYSTIFSGRATEDFQIRFSGKLHGIGARIGRRDGHLTAVRVFPDSPAEKGGLLDGDTIIGIDGDPTRPLTVEEAVERIRGPVGSTVALTVLRTDKSHDLQIVRGEVNIPTVETEPLPDRIGYAHVLQVSRSTPDEFRERVDALGALDGLVLDLRGNAGGSMLASAALADFFMAGDVVFRVSGRDGIEAGVRSRVVADPEVAFTWPLAVLVDETTASAAEIFSGAIAPLSRVTLIGEKTFGKGVIQRVMDLQDENLLKLTVGEYRLSGNRAIHLRGIEPDIALFPISTERLGPLGNLPANVLAYLRKPGEDDRFPIEVGQAVAARGRFSGLRSMRVQADEEIGAHLAEVGIEWIDPAGLPEVLPQRLEIRGEALQLVCGEARTLRLRVVNPNAFPIPSAWLALQSPTTYIPDRLLPLGELPARGSAVAEFELAPPDGISARDLPVLIHLAAGRRTLQSQRLVLQIEPHTPRLEIRVARKAENTAEVTVVNRNTHATGELRVDLPGATRALENLAPGEEKSLELPIAEHPRAVAVTLMGPNVQRRIEVPLREGEVVATPPEVELERSRFLGRMRLHVKARAEGGLHEGWIDVDGEKQVYAHWDGRDGVAFSLPLEAGDHGIRTRVETSSGVAVIDSRVVTAD